MNPQQKINLEKRRVEYESKPKYDKDFTQSEIILLVLNDNPNNWYFTWELIGSTKYGWLSHASHATLRKLEQEGKIHKEYIDKYVIYTHKDGVDRPIEKSAVVDKFI